MRRGQPVVCTDGGSALLNLEKDLGVPAKSLVVSYDGHVMDGVYRVQSVNSYRERLKPWVNRQLRGVATKNLPLDLAWMRLRTWGGANGAEPATSSHRPSASRSSTPNANSANRIDLPQNSALLPDKLSMKTGRSKFR